MADLLWWERESGIFETCIVASIRLRPEDTCRSVEARGVGNIPSHHNLLPCETLTYRDYTGARKGSPFPNIDHPSSAPSSTRSTMIPTARPKSPSVDEYQDRLWPPSASEREPGRLHQIPSPCNSTPYVLLVNWHRCSRRSSIFFPSRSAL
jgi:hypothetical protein